MRSLCSSARDLNSWHAECPGHSEEAAPGPAVLANREMTRRETPLTRRREGDSHLIQCNVQLILKLNKYCRMQSGMQLTNSATHEQCHFLWPSAVLRNINHLIIIVI